jgi:hypothetical protein
MASKVCITCHTEKPLAEYHKDKTSKDGHRGKCKPCTNTKRAAYYEATKKVAQNPQSEPTLKQKLAQAMSHLSEHIDADHFDDIFASLEEIKKLTYQRQVENKANTTNSIRLNNIHIPSIPNAGLDARIEILRGMFAVSYMQATGQAINSSNVGIIIRKVFGEYQCLVVYDGANLTEDQREAISQSIPRI